MEWLLVLFNHLAFFEQVKDSSNLPSNGLRACDRLNLCIMKLHREKGEMNGIPIPVSPVRRLKTSAVLKCRKGSTYEFPV